MELESFFIAENAEVVSGKFFAFGGGIDHIKAAHFPAVVPSLAVIVNILVAPSEAASVTSVPHDFNRAGWEPVPHNDQPRVRPSPARRRSP